MRQHKSKKYKIQYTVKHTETENYKTDSKSNSNKHRKTEISKLSTSN